jgi:D-alanyl-D-alanine carboxypeptidase/D-alanyl-D-alanine-endopeptidase (penicillin-binding protein 4)
MDGAGTMIRTARTLVVAAVLLAAPAALPSDPVLAGDVGSRVAATVAAKQAKSLRFSLCVWDAQTGEVVHGSNATTARRPASVAKVATTAAAMLALGPDHELETRVLAPEKPDRQGVIEGSLVVRGGGDPGFGPHFDPRGAEAALRDFAKQVRAAGVRRVQGDLVLDATAFAGAERHPSWGWADGEWGWDQAPVTALVLNDNCVTVTVAPGAAVGSAAVVRLAPATTAVGFTNRAVTVATRKEHNLVFGRTAADGRIPITGGVLAKTQGFTDDLACVDPVLYFGDVFRRLLREEGVEIAGATVPMRSPAGGGDGPRVTANVDRDLVTLARHGTPVSKIAAVANTRSQNLYAELLLRELGRVKLGDGSFAGGARAATQVLGFAAGDPQFHLSDGCGYSREDQLSADAVGRILARMYASPHRTTYMLTMARAGDPEGTLRTRFREAKYKDRVLAKTGTLRDTKALAGWALGKSGRVYSFAILCEGDNGRAIDLQNAVVSALVDE